MCKPINTAPAAQEVSAGPRAGKEGGGREWRGEEGMQASPGSGGALRESKELRDAEDPAMPPLRRAWV